MGKIADLYIRVSTDEQADKGYSLRDQEDRLRRYCELKEISVRNVYIEDYSAKTFNRPEWKKLITALRKQKNIKNVTLLLFTKWDRFSRNTSQAYQTIDILRSLRSEPQAIEQPLDMSIPESKIMLSHYLTIPEVENERRALNVFYGMRRARKEGRWMGTAPLGYVNKITEDHKKYIAIKEVEAEILIWAFDKILENSFNTNQIWKMVREKAKGMSRFSKNNFWTAIRNPIYCGKIFIPAFKDEEAYFVKGLHEPIISELKFREVQDVLDGRKRDFTKPKIVSMDNLPLRGFLKCPKCERMLTGSASKGKLGRYYYYYHCSSQCGVRFRAPEVNAAFERQLSELLPRPGMSEVFIETVLEDFQSKTKKENIERKQMLKQVEDLNARLQKALIQKVDGTLDDDDYNFIKKDTYAKIERLEFDLSHLSDQNTEISRLLKSELAKIINLYKYYVEGDMEQKRQIISSMFPEKLVFDGEKHRTPRINSAVQLIYSKEREIRGNKKGTNLSFLDLSQQVAPPGIEPGSKV
ncbi:recombinase family protein [Chryseobacterium indologenes]|uniref:recombinase family protein n=1 Tax=Chryseobacterium indologenes TaxID=253 RepID=UPI0003E07A57|nr:recombinase family protein [Chryseobacterium indologenes]QPQ53939.1 recombinase family protein [Chryseobacterium indologenes]GAE66754.1 hypothetical protein CIN01S_18_00810 [Chryseobacterium indologenes NBRC 14944]